MALRCRKGDIAVVVHGNKSGLMCDVLNFVGTRVTDGGTFHNLWHISYRGQTQKPGTSSWWVAPDSWLLPIRPGDLDETEENEKTMEFTE